MDMMKKTNKYAEQYASSLILELLQNRDPIQTAQTRKRMLIAARLEEILNELGWKKKDLAEKLGKNPSEVTKWMSGTHNFTTDTLSEIEQVTGKSLIQVWEKTVYPENPSTELQGVKEESPEYVPMNKATVTTIIKYRLRDLSPDDIRDLQEKYPDAEVWIELGPPEELTEEGFRQLTGLSGRKKEGDHE